MPGMFDRDKLAREMTHHTPTNYNRPYINSLQALGMLGVPLAGTAGDMQMYNEAPEERTLLNAIGTGLGALPLGKSLPMLIGAIGPMLRSGVRYPKLIPALRNRATQAILTGEGINSTHPNILATVPNSFNRLRDFEAGFVDSSGRFYSRTEAADYLLSKTGIAAGQGSRGTERADFDRLFPGLESYGNANMYKWWNQASPGRRERLFNRVRRFVERTTDLPKAHQPPDTRFPTLETGASQFGEAADDFANELARDFGLDRETGLEVIWQ